MTPALAGLLHQSDFPEIFYCTGMKWCRKPLEHAPLFQIDKGGMLSPKSIEIFEYHFRYGVDHLLRDFRGGAQGGHNAESVHVVQRTCQASIKPLHLNQGLDVITIISHQFVNVRAGNWDNTGLALVGECPANGLARMPNREKIGVDAVVLEQGGRFRGSYCLRRNIPIWIETSCLKSIDDDPVLAGARVSEADFFALEIRNSIYTCPVAQPMIRLISVIVPSNHSVFNLSISCPQLLVLKVILQLFILHNLFPSFCPEKMFQIDIARIFGLG